MVGLNRRRQLDPLTVPCASFRWRQSSDVFQSRMGDQQQYPPSAYGGKTADEVFERSLKFTELPQHNHVQMLDGLAKNTKPADLPRDISGGFPMAISPNIDRAEVWGYPQPDVSETAGGLATGGSGNGSNYGEMILLHSLGRYAIMRCSYRSPA